MMADPATHAEAPAPEVPHRSLPAVKMLVFSLDEVIDRTRAAWMGR